MSTSLPAFAAAVSGNFSFRPPFALLPLKTHHSAFLSVTSPSVFTRPNLQSAQTLPPFKRKLLCPPVFGKYIRDDYLVKMLTAKEIQDLIMGERTVPIIVDFFSTWCGPCILMAQELEMLAVECEKNALIVKVDTDDEYEFARDMQVRGLPTVFFFSPDPTKDAIRAEGLIPIQMMRDIINNQL